jgi:hypothetical protein
MRCVRLYLPLEFYRAPPIPVRSAPRNLNARKARYSEVNSPPSTNGLYQSTVFFARELCQLNRAISLYEPRSSDSSNFRIVFIDPQRWEK